MAVAEVRDIGLRLYTIALGGDVDAAALVRMAGDARRYHIAPDSATLAAIYAEIAQEIACPVEAFWGQG